MKGAVLTLERSLTPTSDRKPDHRAEDLLALVAAFLLATLATWPLALHLSTRVAGYLGIEDLEQTLWLYWWWTRNMEHLVAQAPQTGLGHAAAEFFRFPLRAGMGSFLDFVPTWPLGALGFPLYYNLKTLLVLALDGWSAWLLVRTLHPGSRWGAATAGAVFMLCPLQSYHVSVGRMEQLVAFPMVFFLLELERALRQRTLGPAARAGLWLGLTAASYWFYGVFALLLGALRLATAPALPLRSLALMGSVTAGVCAPFLWAYAQAARAGQFHDPRIRFFSAFPALADIPSQQSPDFFQQIVNASASLDCLLRPVDHHYVPLAVTAAALAALLVDRRGRRFWGAAACVLFVLALGPYLKWGGQAVEPGLPLPYHLPYALVPFFTKLNWPSRLLVPAFLALAVWIGLAVERIPDRRGLLAGGFLACLLVELAVLGLLPPGTTDVRLAPFYRELPQAPEGTGVIELPATGRDARELRPGADMAVVRLYEPLDEKHVNYLQMHHGRKALWSGADHPPAPGEPDPALVDERRFHRNTLLAWLVRLEGPPDFSAEDRLEVVRAGYRYAVLHERAALRLGPDAWPRMSRALEAAFGPPLRAEEEWLWEAPANHPGGDLAVPFESLRFRSYRVLVFGLEQP